MSSDFSRQRFDPQNDFAAVLMQQGRVLLDADWNEWIEILDRRIRAETVDIIGRGIVPTETPDAFRITLVGGHLTIGLGRMYVDGLLAENHGAGPETWDDTLAELRGTQPVAYQDQPYLPDAEAVAPLPEGGGPHLVYLKVWQREVTWLEDPDLVESAVGVDSTSRWQTVWQVRLLEDVGDGVTCATADAEIPGWLDETAPSGGRLTTGTTDVEAAGDPCIVPPTGGYKGLENRLYRVEVHAVDEDGQATFKWARHNASIATAVRSINGTNLVVDLVGRDAELRFSTGDWVEITDDVRELAGLPGIMRRIADVTDATRTLTLESALPAGTFPTDVGGATLPARHTRVRRWDQRGQVRTTDGDVQADLSEAGSTGVIPVASDGTSIVLEDGIFVTFSLEADGTRFRPGDYWVFAARSADASIEILTEAPPRGIHAHYCRLAVVTFPETVIDCRTFWPPECAGGGCDCTVCVTPETHEAGTLTIQQALDQVRATGGTVCLAAGIYNIPEPLRVEGALSVRMRGQGWQTLLVHTGPGAAMHIRGCLGFTLERLSVVTSRLEYTPADVGIANCGDIEVRACYFLQLGGREVSKAAIGLSGAVLHARLQDNVFFAAGGISNASLPDDANDEQGSEVATLLTLGLRCERNQMLCEDFGVRLRGLCLHTGETVIADNFVNEAQAGGIRLTGYVAAKVLYGSRCDIRHNTLRVAGDGIVCGTDNTRIDANDIGQFSTSQSGHGIVIQEGVSGAPITRLQITGNRIDGLEDHGIYLLTAIESALIKLNQIEDVEGAAILMDPDASAGHLAVENNQIVGAAALTRAASDSEPLVAGVHLLRVRDLDFAGNSLRDTGVNAGLARRLVGVQFTACGRVRCDGNRIVNLGPLAGTVGDTVSIAVLGSHRQVSLANNTVLRQESPPVSGIKNVWYALQVIARPQPDDDGNLGTRAYALGHSGHLAWSEDREYVLGSSRLSVQAIAPGGMQVRGNTFEGESSRELVQIQAGRLILNDNSVRRDDQGALLAHMAAEYIVMNGNHFESYRGDQDAVRLQVPQPTAPTHVPEPVNYAVLGNIVSGLVRINGQRLPEALQTPYNREMI
ncbi:MAG: right handed beta helix region family protein [Puniceicoccaceae bacterium 5H]|nr:MAG: right handed beta helix region family protein [Puniceicoccaceae bacterium 5H]